MRHLPICLALLALPAGPVAAAPPSVRLLRTQQVGDVTYFHVRIEAPRGLTGDGDPALVPQDDKARNVCPRRPDNAGRAWAPVTPEAPPGTNPTGPVPAIGLEFVGTLTGEPGEAAFLLRYPAEGVHMPLDRFRRNPPTTRTRWVEAPVTLDLAKTEKVKVPAEAAKRKAAAGKHVPDPRKKEDAPPVRRPPVADDLEGLWGEAQAAEFGRLAGGAGDFGFYSFAAEATARKYGIPTPPVAWGGGFRPGRGREIIDRQLFETTTGAAAITESLQLERMLNTFAPGDAKDRTVDVATIQGIDVAEHPWDKMMADKKPAPEPLARLVPADNWYVSFKNVRKLLEFNDLLEQWGTSLVRAYEVHSRDYRLKERYQQQLCLETTQMARTLGPLVLRGIAATGNDLYLREGSDLTLIFHVVSTDLFRAAVNPFIDRARKKHGEALKEDKTDLDGVTIESYVTPRRDVSLHRAFVDDFVIYSNSEAGIRRMLDARKNKIKALSDSKDFQYMRTVFAFNDKAEDGFVFLSDPFIRQLVGPASKIKEKRRLEALTSLNMLHEGALYTAWLTGKPPAGHAELVAFAGLKPEETPTPQGRAISWDVERQEAFSDAYNTARFATPLVELAIDKVTPQEAEAYRQFRLQYLGLWRQYFDPVGMRISVSEKEVKLDTFILPLIQNTQYNELRRVTGEGTISLTPGKISSKTLVQFMLHLTDKVGERHGIFRDVGMPRDNDIVDMVLASLDPVGNWFLVRLDESPVYARLAAMLDHDTGVAEADAEEIARLAFQIPIVIGADIKNPLTFGAALTAARVAVLKALPGGLTWEPLPEPYKGVPIVRIQATDEGMRQVPFGPRRPRLNPFRPAIYYAMIDGGFYLSPNETMLHDLIDRARDKEDTKATTVEVASSLYLSPAAADRTKAVIQKYLEAQVRQQALANDPVWYALYHAGLVKESADVKAAQATAERWLGFVPVSPDGAPYSYDPKKDEVINRRHGTLRQPKTHKELAEEAPLHRLLEQLKSIRADLRFREDGIHTGLTVDRQAKEEEK